MAIRLRLPGVALFLLSALACGATLASAQSRASTPAPLSVMTFNIRYAHTQPPDLWPDRLPVMSEMIQRRRPDVIGTQEGLYPQLIDLQTSLPDYAWIGTGRDGDSKGEFMAVFYRKDRLQPLAYENYWLSDTPAIAGSRTWGNNYPRMVTSVRFRDRINGGEFLFVNTHFDHEVQISRERSASLIIDQLAATSAGMQVILTGDFNAGVDNPVYAKLTGDGGFTDSWVAAKMPDTLGTFHGFKGIPAAKGTARIDWILWRGAVEVLSSEIVTDSRGTQLPSDHFPVVAKLRVTPIDQAKRP